MGEHGRFVRRLFRFRRRRFVSCVSFSSVRVNGRRLRLRETFEPCGKVVNVRVRKPGRDGVPATENRGKTHALVEFETPNEAKEAVSRLDNPADWRNGLRVRIQLKPGQKKKKKLQKII